MSADEKPIKVLKMTRKAFFLEYGCGVGLFGLYSALLLSGVSLGHFTLPLLGFCAIPIGAAELQRMFVRYKITPGKMIMIKGIIKRQRKDIYYHPLAFVPDINLHQTRWQRLLGYGDIFLLETSNESYRITNVNNPREVMSLLEDLIHQTKK